MLKMIHPDIEAVATVVSEDAFLQVWAPRDWELLGAAESFACDALGRDVKDASSLTLAEARELCAARAAEYPKGAKRDEVVSVFLATFGQSLPAPDGGGESAPAAQTTTEAPAGANKDKDVR